MSTSIPQQAESQTHERLIKGIRKLVKDLFEKIMKRSFWKPTTIAVSVLVLYAVFHVSFEDAINTILVDPIFSQVDKGPWNDIFFLVVAALIIGWGIYYGTKSYIISRKRLIPVLLLGCIYGYYRLFSQEWVFTEINIWEELKYTDLIFLVSATVIVVYTYVGISRYRVVNRKQKSTNDIGFFLDEPITETSDDTLRRKEYAKAIAERIEATENTTAFAIGIMGAWGTGKTSFMNILEKEIPNTNKDILIVKFNPWRSSTPQTMIQDFFETLCEELAPYHSGVSQKLTKYAQKLAETVEATGAKPLAGILGISLEESTARQYEEINTALRYIGKKIIVLIDDLDRLDEQELVEVLRLIRNTANFNNTVFIVAYDRGYLTSAIRKFSEHNAEYFLEKIFQLEVHLPYLPVTRLAERLESLLTKNKEIDTEYCQKIHQIVYLVGQDTPFYWNIYISTMRDVNRFSNGFRLHYDLLSKDTDISDLFYLEILRFKYPKVYELLNQYKSEFLETKTSDSRNDRPRIILRFGRSNFFIKKSDRDIDSESTELETYIRVHCVSLMVQEEYIHNVMLIIRHILPSNFEVKRERFSISYPENFLRYFSYSLLEEDISESEFEEYRNKGSATFYPGIEKWLEHEEKWVSLFKLFERTTTFRDKEDFETIITGIFFAVRYISSRGENPQFYYQKSDVFNKLFAENRSEKLYNKKDEEFSDFILKLFDGNNGDVVNKFGRAYIFESEFLRRFMEYLCHIQGDEQYDYVSGDDSIIQNIRASRVNRHVNYLKLQSFAINHLQQYLNKVQSWDDTITSLMWCCITGSNSPDANKTTVFQRTATSNIISTNVRKPVKKFIKKDIDTFLVSLLRKRDNPHSNDDNYYIQKETVGALWDSWEEFDGFVRAIVCTDCQYLDEFQQFLEKFKQNDYEPIIYNFSSIPYSRIADSRG